MRLDDGAMPGRYTRLGWSKLAAELEQATVDPAIRVIVADEREYS